MFIRSTLISAATALFLTGMSPREEVHSLAGRFECITKDSQNQIWRVSTVNKPYGAWLRLDARYPAQNGQPAGTAITLVGFDNSEKRWNIVSVDGDGTYYTRYSTSHHFDGSQWVDGFPADGGRAVVRITSSAEYTFDLTTPTGSGKTSRSHTVCMRL